MHNMEWDSIRIFLAVAEEGSMSAAALKLGMSQPTVSRHVLALEEKVGFNLFDRSTQGLGLTAAGKELLGTAKEAAKGVDGFIYKASEHSGKQVGHVRLAASDAISYYWLPSLLNAFRRQFPAIEIEILVANKEVNLNKREADLLISKVRPEQSDLVVSLLHSEPIGFYAHRDYLKEFGYPTSVVEMHNDHHQVIGYDQQRVYIDTACQFGNRLNKSQFNFRTDSFKMQLELARAKAGIAVVFHSVAERYPELEPIHFPEIELPDANWWLVCHHDVHINPRIRYLMAFISEWFRSSHDKIRLIS
ncbi:LysR family transcriptional regulator (plasmid) [Photobacterium sp. DA100]|uniref:LysR family transcriptional regulator n=1 Tax=Photobacterium sp. DA100 TaxID=3027472 RepID=UPI002479E2B2|nr:LysR family transcriptional regulator [Photobacterium sp. DA100]WEM44902.1 LysR family transcriptional regulator [Photobacterium sp. DA100]